MSIRDRGFASMDRARHREIARRAGRIAHQTGAAHVWTSEEARVAGRKGARVRAEKRALLAAQAAELQRATDHDDLA